MSTTAPVRTLGARLKAVGSGTELSARRQGLLLGVCCLAQFMVILDVSIVNVALPSIRRSLGFAPTDLQWVVNAYTITFAGFLMLSGRVADLWGGRRTFVLGLLLFSLASLVGGTAVDRQVLLAGRALQGLGGAIMAASSLAIITSSFAAGPERHRAIGLWGAMNGAGGATGTLLGGIITQELTWRWVLLINLPIGIAAALIARAVVVDRRRASTAGSFDLAGALTVTGGLLALVYGIVNTGTHGWGSWSALGPIALGIGLLIAFVVIEGRFASEPLVPLAVFANRLQRMANLVVMVFSAALFPMWFFASLYLQEVLHFGPLDAGLAFLPMALTIMACATRAGGLVGRFGAGPVLATGLGLMAVGLALFGRVVVNGDYLSDFLVPGMLASIGIGLSVVPSTIAATATAAPGEAGLASGLVNTSRQMGGALGLAILTSLAVLYTTHLTTVDYRAPALAVDDGFRLAFVLAAGFAAIGAVLALMFIPRNVRPPTAPLVPVRDPHTADTPPPAGPPAAPAAEPAVSPAVGAVVRPASEAPQGAAVAADAEPSGARVGGPPHRPAGRRAGGPPGERAGGRSGERAAGPTSGRTSGEPTPSVPLERALAAVVYSLPDGGRWPVGAGSMTVGRGGSGASRRGRRG